MPYREEKDLVQNCKELYESIEGMSNRFSSVESSMERILELRTQFEDIANQTTATIQLYKNELNAGKAQYEALITTAESKIKQVTNEVQSLVNLQVNFSDIKNKILECLSLATIVEDIVKGPFIRMDKADPIPIEERVPYKHYHRIVDSITIGELTGQMTGSYIVSPGMAISYDAP